jgi:hypothetical protein
MLKWRTVYPAERLSAFSKVPFRSVSYLRWQLSLLSRFASLAGIRLCRRAEIRISGFGNDKYKNIRVIDLAHNSWEAEIKRKF